ncbi:kinetochore protein Spc25 isoform X5 [Odocoileus virginianus]|uniref:Kinetochore protein SPC25 n=1 Tax=Odocoileus virginianus TaxID=9874 RepID=A0ABM4IWI9_ODOVR
MVEDELALFDKSINEFWNKFKSTVSDTSCQMVGLRDAYKDSIKAFAEKLSVKLKEEERMVEMFLEYQNPISTANKANEERLKRLQKSADLYKDRLGLEIRKIYGDKLQFIFTDIDPKHPDRPFMFSLCLNEARDYEGQSVLTDVVFVSWKTHACFSHQEYVGAGAPYHHAQVLGELLLRLCHCGSLIYRWAATAWV